MPAIAHIAMFTWIPIILVLFATLPIRKAVVIAFVGGFLFLPVITYNVDKLPPYDKNTATCLGVFIATLFFNTERFLRFRFHAYDIPAIVLSLVPIAASLSNGLGLYDGLSAAFRTVVFWLLPYFLGRLYFANFNSLKDLATGIFLGGVVYVPFCLWEIRMSPQLHRQVYGLVVTSFVQIVRYGGYRPVVFVGGSGLLLSLFMAMATLCGYWLWRTKVTHRILGLPMLLILPALFFTTILTKSTFAIILLFAGLVVLEAGRLLKSKLPIMLLTCVPVLFILLRLFSLWDGMSLVTLSERYFGSVRAQSAETRVVNDTVLAEWAWKRPILGWAGWGRNRPPGTRTITDSLWIIIFGTCGLVGLFSWMLLYTIPVYRMAFVYKDRSLFVTRLGLILSLYVCLVITFMYNTQNSATFPLMIVLAGGLTRVKL